MTQKQLINANNAELNNVKAEVAKLPMADDVKNGRYVWGKYDAKGGTLLSYTVSDLETAYPDGGEKDGFWWEMVKEGLPITQMGFTKFTYGSFTLSSSNEGSYTIEHNLGAKLKKLIVYTEDSLVRKNYGIRQLSLVDRYTSYSGGGEEYYFQFGAIQNSYDATREGFSTFESAIPRFDVTTSKVALKLDTVNYLVGGKKYYWMAMA